MKNQLNMFSASAYFQTQNIPPPVNMLYVSQKLSDKLNSAIMFALVENLWYCLDSEKLNRVLKEATEYQPFCNKVDFEAQHNGCLHLVNIITQMMDDIQKGAYLQSNTLRDNLEKHRQQISAYFEWSYARQKENELLEEISIHYGKTIIIYQVQQGQLAVKGRTGGDDITPMPCLQKILLLSRHQEYRVIYEYSPWQLDSIALLTLKLNQLSATKLAEKEEQIVFLSQRVGFTQQVLAQVEDSYRQRLAQTESMHNHALNSILELKRAIQATNSEKEHFKQQLYQLREYANGFEKQFADKNRSLYKANEEIHSLKQKIEQVQEFMRRSEQELENLRIQNRTLKDRLNRLENDNIRLTEQMRNNNKPNQVQQESILRNSIRIKPPPPRPKIPVDTNEVVQIQPFVQLRPLRSGSHEPKRILERFGGSGDVDKVRCQICEEMKQSYNLFHCAHGACKRCLLENIKSQVRNNAAQLKCPANCGKPEDSTILSHFLQNFGQRELLEQYNIIKINKRDSNEKLMTCKACKGMFYVPKANPYFTCQCGVTSCMKCGEPHDGTVKCQSKQAMTVIEQLERPLICPQCTNLFDMDDKCKHVTCKDCSAKNLQPNGICPVCSALRDPIMTHDNSYHRPDCSLYVKPAEQPRYTPLKCLGCQRLGRLCDRPTETFKQFVCRVYSEQLFNKIQQIRHRNP